MDNLVSEFETMKSTGQVSFQQEKFYYELIEFYQNEIQFDKAIEVVDYALSEFQFRSEFYLIKARLLYVQNNFEESLAFVEMAENIAPFEFDIQLFKVKVLGALGFSDVAKSKLSDLEKYANKSDLIEIYMCESFLYEWCNDFDGMFQSLKKSLILNPLNEDALYRINLSVDLTKNYEESIFLHKVIIDESPYNALAWYNLGHAYESVGEYQQAIEALEYSFIINDDFEEGYIDCAELCFQLKKYDKALEIYKDILDNFGPDEEFLFSLAHCQYQLGRYVEAKDSLRQTIQLDPYHDEAFYLIANCYLKQNSINQAIKSLNRAIYLDDTREEYYHSLARCYINIGEFETAKTYYSKAALKGKEQALYWEEYISFLIKLEDYEVALIRLQEAEKHTYSEKLQYCKAAVLFKMDLRKEALLALEEALVEDLTQAKFFFDLVPELRKDSDILSAIRYFKGE